MMLYFIFLHCVLVFTQHTSAVVNKSVYKANVRLASGIRITVRYVYLCCYVKRPKSFPYLGIGLSVSISRLLRHLHAVPLAVLVFDWLRAIVPYQPNNIHIFFAHSLPACVREAVFA